MLVLRLTFRDSVDIFCVVLISFLPYFSLKYLIQFSICFLLTKESKWDIMDFIGFLTSFFGLSI